MCVFHSVVFEECNRFAFFAGMVSKGATRLDARIFAERILGRLKGETRLRMRVILHSVCGR